MNIPPIMKTEKFWEAVSWILAGIAALLVLFNVIPAQYALGAGVILAFIKSALKFFGVPVEIRARGLK